MTESIKTPNGTWTDTVQRMKKNYYTLTFGRGRHSVNFHDGAKTNKDGSPFYDLIIFSNIRARDRFVRKLRAEGYREWGILR